MLRRAREGETESLEFLLDTICNVFGGIILMAILVVIETQASVWRMPAEQANVLREQNAAERQLVSVRIARLERERDVYAETIRGLTSPGVSELVEARERFAKAVTDARDSVGALRQATAQANDDVRATASLLASDKRSRDDADRRVAVLRQQAENLPKRIPRSVRLPHRRGNIRFAGRNYLVIDDRVYPVENVQWFGAEYQTAHCVIKPLAESGQWAALIRPRPNAGVPAPGGNRDDAPFLRTLNAYPPSRYSLVFFVADSSKSFETFQDLKRIGLEREYEYAVDAYDAKQGLIVVPSSPAAE